MIAKTYTGWAVKLGDRVALVTNKRQVTVTGRQGNIIIGKVYVPATQGILGRGVAQTKSVRLPKQALGLV